MEGPAGEQLLCFLVYIGSYYMIYNGWDQSASECSGALKSVYIVYSVLTATGQGLDLILYSNTASGQKVPTSRMDLLQHT